MGDSPVFAEWRKCAICGIRTYAKEKRCPKCGSTDMRQMKFAAADRYLMPLALGVVILVLLYVFGSFAR